MSAKTILPPMVFLLQRKPRTAEELADLLGCTVDAARSWLNLLLEEGLVQRAPGACRQPATWHWLTVDTAAAQEIEHRHREEVAALRAQLRQADMMFARLLGRITAAQAGPMDNDLAAAVAEIQKRTLLAPLEIPKFCGDAQKPRNPNYHQ